MDPKWRGPYSITKCLGKGLYMLKAVDNPHVVVSRVNGAHIKPYTSAEPDQQSDYNGYPILIPVLVNRCCVMLFVHIFHGLCVCLCTLHHGGKFIRGELNGSV